MTHGQGRAFLIITKLRTRQPPYLDIPLIDTRAAGELGEAGVMAWNRLRTSGTVRRRVNGRHDPRYWRMGIQQLG